MSENCKAFRRVRHKTARQHSSTAVFRDGICGLDFFCVPDKAHVRVVLNEMVVEGVVAMVRATPRVKRRAEEEGVANLTHHLVHRLRGREQGGACNTPEHLSISHVSLTTVRLAEHQQKLAIQPSINAQRRSSHGLNHHSQQIQL